MRKLDMRKLSTIVSLLYACTLSAALDIELIGYSCSQLPITADINLRCDRGSRCTFGDYATVYGTLYYSGIEYTAVQDDYAYISADIALWTLGFNLMDKMMVPLCYEEEEGDNGNNNNNNNNNGNQNQNQNECPGNGGFPFYIEYKLPSAGKPSISWMASGWKGTGSIQMFAQMSDNTLIGDCELEFQTYVTPKSDSLLQIPSARVASHMGLALMGLTVLVSLYCCFCAGRRRRKKKSKILGVSESGSVLAADDITTLFRKLEDERTTASKASKREISVKKPNDNSSVISDLA